MRNLFVLGLFAAVSVGLSAVADDSLYQISGKWRDQRGQEFAWSSLAGQPVVIAMAYTGCKYSCPLTINKLKEIERGIHEAGVKSFRIVVASFDPKGDKPDRLQSYAREKKLDPNRWILLSPVDDEAVRMLAAVLGITYQRTEDGDFGHSNVITLLDSKGLILTQLNGLGAEVQPLVKRAIKP